MNKKNTAVTGIALCSILVTTNIYAFGTISKGATATKSAPTYQAPVVLANPTVASIIPSPTYIKAGGSTITVRVSGSYMTKVTGTVILNSQGKTVSNVKATLLKGTSSSYRDIKLSASASVFAGQYTLKLKEGTRYVAGNNLLFYVQKSQVVASKPPAGKAMTTYTKTTTTSKTTTTMPGTFSFAAPAVNSSNPGKLLVTVGGSQAKVVLYGKNLDKLQGARVVDNKGYVVPGMKTMTSKGTNKSSRSFVVYATKSAKPGSYFLSVYYGNNKPIYGKANIVVQANTTAANKSGNLSIRRANTVANKALPGNLSKGGSISGDIAKQGNASQSASAGNGGAIIQVESQTATVAIPAGSGNTATDTSLTQEQCLALNLNTVEFIPQECEFLFADTNAGGDPNQNFDQNYMYGDGGGQQPREANPMAKMFLETLTEGIRESRARRQEQQMQQQMQPSMGGDPGYAQGAPQQMAIAAQPDLILSSCKAHPENPTTGDGIYLSFDIENLGQGAANFRPGSSLFVASLESHPDVAPTTVTGQLAIAAGTRTRRFTQRWEPGSLPAGEYMATVVADPNQVLGDANPDNNIVQCSFIVSE